MTILVTGSSGYIASRVVPSLKERGYTLVGVDRRKGLSNSLDKFIEGDLLDDAVLKNSLEGVDCVLHLAAAKQDFGVSDAEYFRDNLEGTRGLIQAGRKHGVVRWLFYSSVSTIGPSGVPADEQASLAPNTAYGQSKAQAEKLFHNFGEEDQNVMVIIVRPSVVYGPGNYQNTNIYRLIDAIYKNRFIMVGNGEVIKTTSYIDNLASATLFLIERMRRGVQTYICVDEPVMTTGRLINNIYAALQKKQPRWHLPLWLINPIASISDAAASLTGIDFPITAARARKFCTPTYY
ncbi:MAG: NAD-dependent epimerase/dehydratase family protein, partial [Nitrososphaera sp.]